MPDLFVKEVAEDGTETYRVAEASEIEIDEEVVKAHPLFVKTDEQRQKNLDESVERRQKLAEQNVKMQALIAAQDDGLPGGVDADVSPPPEPVDPDKIVELAVARVQEVQNAAAVAKAEREVALDDVIKKHNLPASARTFLAFVEGENLETAAKNAAESGLQFQPTPGGGGAGSSAVRDGLAEVDKALDERFFGAGQPTHFQNI